MPSLFTRPLFTRPLFTRLAAARTHPAVVGLATFATTIALILGQPGASIA